MTGVLNTELKDDVEPTQGAPLCKDINAFRSLELRAFAELNDCNIIVAYIVVPIDKHSTTLVLGCIYRVLLSIEPLSTSRPPHLVEEGILVAVERSNKQLLDVVDKIAIENVIYVYRDESLVTTVLDVNTPLERIVNENILTSINYISYFCINSLSELPSKVYDVLLGHSPA
ncbi:hypothetical protein PABY_08990 [Pyrodictium abyssi]|uniref:Uncharacterized protein n=1 Tax=Pyrodictium abyssi TaxID=54256 RepID=A0ABM8IXL0_9CREN|nr:hypothetical protein PABY_08990 [Pyrodictium abyssi]